MSYMGFIIHHSACPSINGKGYDFLVRKDGTVIPASFPTDPDYIHICLEGDYSLPQLRTGEWEEQLFIAGKLLLRLSEKLGIPSADLFPHTIHCPGRHFPFDELVISDKDRYH